MSTPDWLIPDEQPIDWRSKAFGPTHQGMTIAEVVAEGTSLADLPTPMVTLDAAAIDANLGEMDRYLTQRGLLLAPHGKTTMAPQLWHRQLDAGAFAITVATPWQARVAMANGVKRILHAGAMLDPADLAQVAEFLAADAETALLVWVDSPRTVELIAAGYPRGGRPLQILLDRGAPGARTGARTPADGLRTAEAVAAQPHLSLAGVCAWEGTLVGADGPDGRELVRQFCSGAADTFTAIADAGLFADPDPIITGGGSAYFDIVADTWAPLAERGARIVLRSGCYLVHDDTSYAFSSPFGRQFGSPLRAAMHVWGQVVSRPEPGLALLNIGKRDATPDVMPAPQAVRGRDDAGSARALSGAQVTAMNDQHSYLRLDPASDLHVGEVVRCGIAHPCLTFDKWTVIPVIDSLHAPGRSSEPTMIGAVRTYF